MANYNFTTGSTQLPDVGEVEYNGCTFSPLFESSLSGNAVKDEANRTVRYTEVTLSIDGYVTMGAQAVLAGIAPTMANMHRMLTAQGGALSYTGRGFDIVVNAVGAGVGGRDVAWGPVPELIEFQPLGGGLSAKVKWRVVVRVPPKSKVQAAPNGGQFVNIGPVAPLLLQFNFETSVKYGEDGFSSLSMRGTLEIPMTRSPSQGTRTVPTTADAFRSFIDTQLLKGIDLSRFRISNRSMDTSRDKRTLTWNYAVEEKPYMDLPPDCPIARGSYSVKPAKAGPGLCLWMCTLQATYTLRKDARRRQAYLLFLALLRLRMSESKKANIPDMKAGDQDGTKGFNKPGPFGLKPLGILSPLFEPKPAKKEVEDVRKAILLDFSINEGIYLDSKTVTFSATWRLCTTFSHILIASGLWTKVAEEDAAGRNLWAASMRDISGTSSWLENKLDPNLDVIIDFGS